MPIHDVTIADNGFSGADPNTYHADVTFIEGDRNLTVSGNRSVGDGTLATLFKTTGARITGNAVYGVFNDPAAGAVTDATCNWWGDVRGPGRGGDRVSSGVTYQPWLKLSSLVLGCR